MNKKLQKGIVAAVAATMGTGIVAPVYAASAQTTDLAAQYEAAYKATVKATESKNQKDLTAARVLVDGLYAKVKGTANEYLATTLSAILDPVQQVQLVKLDAAIKAAEKSGKQADVNVARALLVDMPEVWAKAFSSYMDGIQQPIITKAVEAVKKAQASSLQADYDAAKALYDELATVTNNDGVKSWVETALKAELDKVSVKLTVTAVKAVNEKTLEIAGTGLGKLKAEAITLSGNTVKTLTAAADGKTATVVLESNIPADTEQTVTITDADGTKDYNYTYTLSIDTVALDNQIVDNDMEGQTLIFKLNGATTTADSEYLRQSGYSVNFIAVDKDNAAADIFSTGNNQSTTGVLADEVPVGEYNVELQLVKDGRVIFSDKAAVTVRDLEANTTAIGDVELTNSIGFVHNSKTLVTGETAEITEIKGSAAGKVDVALPLDNAVVTSSNESVISVNSSGTTHTLTANVAGNAVITIKVGNITKTVSLTVSNTERKITKITPSESSLKLVKGIDRTIEVTSLDQYGDPIAIGATDITEDITKNSAGTALATIAGGDLLTNADDGETASGFTVTADEKGTGSILFKNSDNKVLGQISVSVTDVDNASSLKVEYAYTSARKTDTFAVGKTADYQVSILNNSGYFNGVKTLVDNTTTGNAPAGQLKVESADPKIATALLVSGATVPSFQVKGIKAGKTDITLKDENGLIVKKFTVTITETPITISKVNFKSLSSVDYVNKTISVKDILDIRTETGKDSIVYGVEHNSATIAKVRLDEANASELILYIDKDNDGTNNTGDVVLGAVTAEILTGATGAMTPGSIAIDTTAPAYTTASKDKGSILFRVIVDKDKDGDYKTSEAIATKVITVNVK